MIWYSFFFDNPLYSQSLIHTCSLSLFLLHAVQILDGVQVYEARARMGEKLAQRILLEFANDCGSSSSGDDGSSTAGNDIDVVIPIPETSRTSALQCAHVLQRPYREVSGCVRRRVSGWYKVANVLVGCEFP